MAGCAGGLWMVGIQATVAKSSNHFASQELSTRIVRNLVSAPGTIELTIAGARMGP